MKDVNAAPPAALFSRTDRSILGRWWWTVDRGLLAAAAALIVIGVVMVTTASPSVAERVSHTHDTYMFIRKHLIFLVPSVAVMLAMSMMPPRMIWRVCGVALLSCLVAMAAVPFFGEEIKGARRWLDFHIVSIQPSEFAKPCFAVVAAWLIAHKKDQPSLSFPAYQLAGALYGLMLLLLIVQPDFGMSFVVSCMFAAQLFLAGLAWIWVGGLFLIGGAGVLMAYLLLPHVHDRIQRFLHPDKGDTYQVDKALDAFRHGGLTGTGPGQGTVKLGLPDAHADFVFAVAGEEFGLLTCFLVLLYCFIVLRGFNRAMDSRDMFVVLAAGGLLTMFGLQALINMGSSVHLLPTKGMTLPFISYGGSSLIAVGFSMGVILALTRRQIQGGIARGSMFSRRETARPVP